MDYRTPIIVSCWLSIAAIASVYMWVFGSKLADILFGIFLPVGLLVIAAIVVTSMVLSNYRPEEKGAAKSTSNQDLHSRLDVIAKEIDQIKKDIEK